VTFSGIGDVFGVAGNGLRANRSGAFSRRNEFIGKSNRGVGDRVIDHGVDHADVDGSGCLQSFAADDDVKCRGDAGESREALRTPGARDNAKTDFGEPDLRIGVGDPVVAA